MPRPWLTPSMLLSEAVSTGEPFSVICVKSLPRPRNGDRGAFAGEVARDLHAGDALQRFGEVRSGNLPMSSA
jgi:hypothetical protein